MGDRSTSSVVFVSLVHRSEDASRGRLLVDSIRTFGGLLAQAPVWLYAVGGQRQTELRAPGVEIHPLTIPDTVGDYLFAGKVWACAQGEERAAQDGRSLVWMSSDCLVVQPPVLFCLEPPVEAAVRPVHIRNVGLRQADALDAFWQGVYRAAGVSEVRSTVDSFVDGQCLRPYFNSHVVVVDPSRRLFRRWWEIFERLVRDGQFQTEACEDLPHRIFLHQAVLSALLTGPFENGRIRLLPPEYSYPYNLQADVPEERRARALNDLVCLAYEDRKLHPVSVTDIELHDPLRAWLSAHLEPA